MKRIPPLYLITLILILIIVICLFHPGLLAYYSFLAALLLASALMMLHLILAWSRLALTRRLGILLSIAAWLGLFYGLLQVNGLRISSFFQ